VRRVVVAPDAYGFVVSDPGAQVVQPGGTIEVKVTYAPDPRRKQAFGGVQIFSNDASFPAAGNGEQGTYVAGIACRANSSWLLTMMIFFPILGALLVLFVPRGKDGLVKWVALAAAAAPMALAVMLYQQYDRTFSMQSGNSGLQFIQRAVWIPSFNVEYYVG